MPSISLLPHLRGLSFSRWILRCTWLLVIGLIVLPIVALFAPWQQHVSGAGRVIAFTPLDRPQNVEAPIKGRVEKVFVTEAQIVEKDEPLVQLVDIDPEKIARIEAKLEAGKRDLALTLAMVDTMTSQTEVLRRARDLTVEAFRAKIEVAQEKLRSSEEKLLAARAEHDFATRLEKRLARLSPEYIEEIKHLDAKARLAKASSMVGSAVADVAGAKAGLRNAKSELGKERETANAYVTELRAKIQGEQAKAQSLRAKVVDLEGELRVQNQQLVRAPRKGRVFRLSVNTGSSIVKQHQVLLQLVPVTSKPAVELFVRGVDAPLIEKGRKVRLMFEGWPAVQWVGWPSAAVGTFGGVVQLVDPRDSGKGRFRVLIVPDEKDKPWPKDRFLRQGNRTKGWVLLNEVSLGFEIWRQLNGFPPALGPTEPDSKGAKELP